MNFFLTAEEGKTGGLVALLQRFIASEMNDLNAMAAPCQESEGEAMYREECMWQSALDSRASDVD